MRLFIVSLFLSIPSIALSVGCSAPGSSGPTGVATGNTGGSEGLPVEATGGTSTDSEPDSLTPGETPLGAELCGTEMTPLSGGATGHGHGTRYWDCCMPHCSWPNNATNLSKVCSMDNAPMSIPIDQDGNAQIQSGCNQADGAYTCYDQSPWAPCDTLAFGFAAVPLAGEHACGSCFKLEFDGRNNQGKYDQNAVPDPGSAQLLGKTMIVMASNTGGDVGGGQFDIMIPGGGVGIFPQGCQNQWGALSEDILGPTHGGMRSKCQEEFNQSQQGGEYVPHMPLAEMQACVRNRCDQAFTNANQKHLLEGCYFYADWMGAADNPTFNYTQIECPEALAGRY